MLSFRHVSLSAIEPILRSPCSVSGKKNNIDKGQAQSPSKTELLYWETACVVWGGGSLSYCIHPLLL